jgi:hypothetical protein
VHALTCSNLLQHNFSRGLLLSESKQKTQDIRTVEGNNVSESIVPAFYVVVGSDVSAVNVP